ncbi:MAG: cysteine synthase family protein [candidate division NC10 bacterium]|nr:cysteine synthase family protein [candidate division NC10 bacterium]
MFSNILETIGHSPMVKIQRMNPNPAVTLAVKLEGGNPGGSVKDRAALFMIEGAERRGELTPGKIILEPTSGNTGIGLAMVAAVKGYRVLVILPENMSMERRRILRAYGADFILTPAEKGTDGAIERAREIYRAHPERYYFPNQFANPDNVRAHYEGTAGEIWGDTEGRLDLFVAGIGTTGTLMGVGRRLRELKPTIRIVGVEPMPGHRIQGLKNLTESEVPEIFDPSLLDEIVRIEDDLAFEAAIRLAREEGIFAGISSGAVMAGALEVARKMQQGLGVALLPDRGEKYLSSEQFCQYCERPCRPLLEKEGEGA